MGKLENMSKNNKLDLGTETESGTTAESSKDQLSIKKHLCALLF
jgi:hypothetical protein